MLWIRKSPWIGCSLVSNTKGYILLRTSCNDPMKEISLYIEGNWGLTYSPRAYVAEFWVLIWPAPRLSTASHHPSCLPHPNDENDWLTRRASCRGPNRKQPTFSCQHLRGFSWPLCKLGSERMGGKSYGSRSQLTACTLWLWLKSFLV